jgi:hypothetical protein
MNSKLSFKILFENIQLSPYVKRVYDDATDTQQEITGEKFHIKFPDGAHAFGTIFNNIANIVDIHAPRDENRTTIRGTKTYQRVIEQLKDIGVKTININLQSADSRTTIKKLINSGMLKNPRHVWGISVDEYPTTFDV